MTTAHAVVQDRLQLGGHSLASRLIVGTGKYSTYELMSECLEASGRRKTDRNRPISIFENFDPQMKILKFTKFQPFRNLALKVV